jgi:Mannosylglycerate hydrolase MGH1-like glycoside hydrolase domain
MNGTTTSLRQLAESTLDGNWSGDHTVPSRTLYPHQWSWDSAFISVGLAQVAPDRAWRELRTLFAAQWTDGRVPHIAFNPALQPGDYFPGPDFWDSRSTAGTPPATATSGLVQPPIHAVAAWEVYRHVPDRGELAWLYPRLVAQQRYLRERRDVGGTGLACIVHPWESGLDNSPAWDAPMSAIDADADQMRRYRRHDTKFAAASHRPTDADYARYIAIAAAYRAEAYRDGALAQRHPFLVECPLFNAVNAAAELALAEIAAAVGGDPAPHRRAADRIGARLVERLYSARTCTFHPRDLRTGELIPARTVLGLAPLILPDLPKPQLRAVLAEARSPRFGLPLPSYDRTAADFDPQRYWRGPSWMNVNWLVWRGLRQHGEEEFAAQVRSSMLDLVRSSGCHEYFDPINGQGLGSPDFSWTAALILDVMAQDLG